MPDLEPQLRKLLDGYFDESMEGKIVRLCQMRDYVRRQDPYVVRDEIRRIDDEQEINVLLGVGMKGFLYYAIIAQKAKCLGL